MLRSPANSSFLFPQDLESEKSGKTIPDSFVSIAFCAPSSIPHDLHPSDACAQFETFQKFLLRASSSRAVPEA